jgi:nucleotidyltransferase/DNA polymerase involved in DNA repair
VTDRWSEPILHVDMDAFFVEVERLRRPELRGRPVVVGGAGERSVVAAASYESRRFGIRSAMPMTRARRLCPDLVIVPPDHREYGRLSERVFEVFRSFTPLVEGISVDEAFLDVAGLRLHRPDPVAIGHEIRSVLRSQVGLPASVGVAATKFVAKLASEAAKPDGLRHVLLAEQSAFLAALPVRALWGVGEATFAALAGLGVETVGELSRVPRRRLQAVLGPSLADHLVELADGRDPRPVTPDHEIKSISAEETFERDLATVEERTEALRVLADRVGHRVRRAGLAGRTVNVKVRLADFTTLTRSETLAGPTSADVEIFRIACRLVDRVDRLDRGVRLLGIGLSSLEGRDAPRQLSVEADPRWRELDETVDAVRDRFGRQAIGPARLSRPDRVDGGRWGIH